MSNTQIALDATGTKLNFDSNTFVIDETNNRVGIGTNSPNAKLEISGGLFNCNGTLNNGQIRSLEYNPFAQTITTSNGSLNFTGTDFKFHTNVLVAKQGTQRVGIGTTEPGEKLEVNGGSTATRIKVKTTTAHAMFRVHTDTSDFQIVGKGDSNLLTFYDLNSDKTQFMIDGSGTPQNHSLVLKNGNVGIRTNNPQHRLHIKGAETFDNGFVLENTAGSKIRQYFNDSTANSAYYISYDGTGGAELTLQKNGDLGLNASNGDNVGIGTTQPDRKLEVSQELQIVSSKFTGNNASGHLIEIDHASIGADSYNGFRFLDEGDNATAVHLTHIGASSGRGKLQIGSTAGGTNAVLSVDLAGDGKVGIGTLSPASKLHVEGVISSSGANLTMKDNSGNNITSASQSEGKITVTHNYHQVTHNAGDDTNDVRLHTIDGGVDGAILVLKQQSNDKFVKIMDGTGNLRLAGNGGHFQMNTGNDTITFVYSGSLWFEISRSDNA